MHSSKIYRLACFEEAAGVLHELTESDGIVVADIGRVHLALPLDMKDSFKPLIGQRISVLRTDIPEKPYIFRVISQENANEIG